MVIEELLTHVHPSVEVIIKRSLLQTFVNMVAHHRDDRSEIEQIEKELGADVNFGTW